MFFCTACQSNHENDHSHFAQFGHQKAERSLPKNLLSKLPGFKYKPSQNQEARQLGREWQRERGQ